MVQQLQDGPDDITYTPDPNVCDEMAPDEPTTDSFKYNVIDSQDDNLVSNEATVTVIIECNRGPIKANPDEETTNEDEPVINYPVLR